MQTLLWSGKILHFRAYSWNCFQNTRGFWVNWSGIGTGHTYWKTSAPVFCVIDKGEVYFSSTKKERSKEHELCNQAHLDFNNILIDPCPYFYWTIFFFILFWCLCVCVCSKGMILDALYDERLFSLLFFQKQLFYPLISVKTHYREITKYEQNWLLCWLHLSKISCFLWAKPKSQNKNC